MNKSKPAVVILIAMALFPAAGSSACADALPSRLLRAIVDRDAAAIRAIASNPAVFDDVAIAYLISEREDFRFPGPEPRKSAYAVLGNREVDMSVDITRNGDGSQVIEVIYLPKDSGRSVRQLRSDSSAVAFRDYVACRIEVDPVGKSRMPHACYAETDILE